MQVFFLLLVKIQTIPNHFGADSFATLAAFDGLPSIHSIQLLIVEFVSMFNMENLPAPDC